MRKIKILFVCMGNICRSPTAEGVFTDRVIKAQLSDFFSIDSAGTHAYHVGDAPDLRSQKAARERGIEINHQRARKLVMDDFERFDEILVMDNANYDIAHAACPPQHQHKIKLFLDYAPHVPIREVPDPYYGGARGFDHVLDVIEEASDGLLKALITTQGLPCHS
jgi:protein-tyrosine phosphatase